jgi:hypothetical protein
MTSSFNVRPVVEPPRILRSTVTRRRMRVVPVFRSQIVLVLLLVIGLVTVISTEELPVAPNNNDDDVDGSSTQSVVEYIYDDLPRKYLEPDVYVICTDLRTSCDIWAANGDCETNSLWMHPHCPHS